MNDTKITKRGRGRPRAFDTETALAKAQALFHQRGYDAVSVAALTEELGISPPSFYAAFGSKAGLFEQVLTRYAASALPLDDILKPGSDLGAALGQLLETAAEIYSADRATAGCLVLEAVRATIDMDCLGAAQRCRLASHERVRAFIATTRPDLADEWADFVDLTLSGLSASAREGWERPRLIAAAHMAADALRYRLTA